MRYKLVALDIDGTLVDETMKISPPVSEIIKNLYRDGVIFALATGRMFKSAIRFAQSLEIEGPLITYGGALVKHFPNGKVYFYRPLPVEIAEEVFKILKRFDLYVNVHLEDEILTEKERKELEIYHAISHPFRVKIAGDLYPFIKREPMKLLAINEDIGILEEVTRVLKDSLGEKINVFRSLPNFLEIIHGDASKEKSLKKLADTLNLPISSIIAIGDSFNDIGMIKLAGVGIAMGNAPWEVKSVADFVTLSVKEDGVAWALKKYF